MAVRGVERTTQAAENGLVEEATEFKDVSLLTELVATQQALLAADLELDTVLNEIVSQAHRLTRADAAAVEWLDGEDLVYRAVAGAAERYRDMRMSAATSLSGRCIRSGEILWCHDATSDVRVDRESAIAAGALSTLIVPLFQRRTAVGVIKVYAARPFAFGERELRVVQMLAGTVGAAIARAELLERLADVATSDRLTGLPNRRAWDDRAQRGLARASRSGEPLCLARLDLDHLRTYDDAYGRTAGDTLLKTCAARWWNCVRSVDLLARLGGEEFALLLPGCIAPDAVGAVARLRAVTADPVSVSAGIAQWDMRESLESLMTRADFALETAKRSRRDRVALAEPADEISPEI
jgi:diguanylate cyclase